MGKRLVIIDHWRRTYTSFWTLSTFFNPLP